MQTEEIDQMFTRLNHRQHLFTNHVLRLAELDSEGNQLFLTGGPGVGKSAVLKAIDIGLEHFYNQ